MCIRDSVKSVEIDESLLPILRKTLEGYDNVEIIHGDILKVDLKDITGGKPFTVAANLPYYITTPIIFSPVSYTHLVEAP